MKRLLAFVLTLSMVFCLFAGCSEQTKPRKKHRTTPASSIDFDWLRDFEALFSPVPTQEKPTEPAQVEESTEPEVTEPVVEEDPVRTDYKVALITDYGDIYDQSFNQATWEGVKEWCDEYNVDWTYYKPTDDSTAARVASINCAVADGYNILLMPGWMFSGAIVETAPWYPDVKFIALDVYESDMILDAVESSGEEYDFSKEYDLSDYVDISNVYCAVYQEELAGYMAGYAAVKMGYTKLGFLGGMAVPAVVRYGYGFIQGADEAAAELGNTADVEVKYAYGNQFFGDTDITAYMDKWYAGGTEVVFACGGGLYTSAAEAAEKVGGKVIGVDVDQASTIDSYYGESMTVTSAMKGLGTTVKNMLTEIIINDNWDAHAGKFENLGLVSGTDASLNYVQLPEESTQWNANFTQDDYYELVAKLFDGTLTVSNDTSAEPVVSIAVDYQGNIK